MIKVKTEKELTIELRNEVAARMLGQKTSEMYWREVASKAKKNTPEKVDALAKVALNQQLYSKDRHYLKVIDAMIE